MNKSIHICTYDSLRGRDELTLTCKLDVEVSPDLIREEYIDYYSIIVRSIY